MNSYPSSAVVAALLLTAACGEQPTDPNSDPTPGATPGLRQGSDPSRGEPRFVVTMTNATTENEAVVFPRSADGALGPPARFATGGTGSGGGLGNQASIVLDDRAEHLYLVNAGSNTISVFAIRGNRLVRQQTIASGGLQPISLAVSDRLLYALNDGGTANITGFRIRHDGTLAPIGHSTRPLSVAAPDAAQIGFNRGERRLIVTEKATNTIVTYALDNDGRPGLPEVNPSSGATPFGFAVDPRGILLVSEAFGGAPNGSAVSSYRLRRGALRPISASVGTTETAACWVAVSGDGQFAYVTNTASNTISGYRISPQGELTLLAADGVSGITGMGPIDLATRSGLDFMYSLNRTGGSISFFRVKPTGTIEPGGTTGGLPTSANGLVVF